MVVLEVTMTLQTIKFAKLELYEDAILDIRKLDEFPPPTRIMSTGMDLPTHQIYSHHLDQTYSCIVYSPEKIGCGIDA